MKKEVSFIVVVKDGEDSIIRCLTSFGNQNITDFEIVIVDGMSSDKTVVLAEEFLREKKWDYKIINNPKKTLSSGWNLGIENSNSIYLVRPDAHSILEENYVYEGIKILNENPSFFSVGGVLITKSEGYIGNIIATVLSNPLGVGPSKFRTGLKELVETDTVVYGVYKKKVFDKVGGFNEELKRNQDIEFHKRAKEQGIKMLTSPKMKATYYSRPTIKKFLKQAYNNGFWVGMGHGHFRHRIPFFFLLGVLLIFSFLGVSSGVLFLIFYFTVLLGSYILKSREYNLFKLLILLFMTFLLHFSYGFGSFMGLIKKYKG